MKKILLFFAIVSVAGMLASCNGNGKTAEAVSEEEPVVEKVPTTGDINGHEWVDLGLPSGTKWATCNVGANTPEEAGDYFAWGETAKKDTYLWTNYRFRESGDNYDNIKFNKYNTNEDYGIIDGLVALEAADDAATSNWGEGWHMPTNDEFRELTDSSTMTWTTRNDVKGYEIVGPNGNSIFIPAVGHYKDDGLAEGKGCYWTSTLENGHTLDARYMNLGFNVFATVSYLRYCGLSVRPVCAE